LLSLKFKANTYSFERVVTLFVGYYFSFGHSVDGSIKCLELYPDIIVQFTEHSFKALYKL